MRTAYLVLIAAAASARLSAQSAQAASPPPPSARAMEERLREQPFVVVTQQGTRFKGDRTNHAMLFFADSSYQEVKWAPAPPGGGDFNNEPRYEIAAYALQKLFLDEPDYVVPPTVVRMMSMDDYRRMSSSSGQATFKDAASVLITLQWWQPDVTSKNVFDARRAERDTAYARHLGDLNVLTYLTRQQDANKGNVLLSTDTLHPRLFSVDNGVTFNSPASNRGTEWSLMRVKRLGHATASRLRGIHPEELTASLGVIAQFELRDGKYVAVSATDNIEPNVGIRRKGNVLQLGLSKSEIDGVRQRLEWLMQEVNGGHIKTF